MQRDEAHTFRYGGAAWRLGTLALAGLMACAGDPVAGFGEPAIVRMHAITPSTVRRIVVEVSGPGITPAVLANLEVGATAVADGELQVPAGSGRRFVVTAVDTAGVLTHRADTTVTLVPGANPPLALTMRPLAATVGVTVTFDRLVAGPSNGAK